MNRCCRPETELLKKKKKSGNEFQEQSNILCEMFRYLLALSNSLKKLSVNRSSVTVFSAFQRRALYCCIKLSEVEFVHYQSFFALRICFWRKEQGANRLIFKAF